jgi:hypothetical protein
MRRYFFQDFIKNQFIAGLRNYFFAKFWKKERVNWAIL